MLPYPAINPIAIQLGPLSIRWYALMYLFGIGLGLKLVYRTLKDTLKLTHDQILNIVSAIIIGVLIGGRIGYVLLYDFSYYRHHLSSILKIWEGGMSFHGAAIGSIIAVIWMAKQYQKNHLSLLDNLAFGSTIGLGLGRIGNFINGELYGRPTTVAWGMIFPNGGPIVRHPSQLYEAICEGVLLFGILYVLNKKRPLKPGILLSVFMIGYGIIRFCIEFFRMPDPQLGPLLFTLTMGQLLSILMVGLGLYLYYFIQNKSQKRT